MQIDIQYKVLLIPWPEVYIIFTILYLSDVIHTVGPIGEQKSKLKSCYATVLEIVKEEGLHSVVGIGTYLMITKETR